MKALKGTVVPGKLNVKILIVVIIVPFAIYMIGCGTDDETVGFQVTPPDNSTITPETPITITFDKTPMNVVSLLLFLMFNLIQEKKRYPWLFRRNTVVSTSSHGN